MENKEAGAICFDVRIPIVKRTKNYYGIIPLKIEGSAISMEINKNNKKNLYQYFRLTLSCNQANIE